MATIPLEVRRRARFEALRRSIFAEMGHAQSRMRLAMIAPFHALVLALLAYRGFPPARLTVQTFGFLFLCGLFAFRTSPLNHKSLSQFSLSFLSLLLVVANTGGLASPLLPLCLPMLAAASIILANGVRGKIFFGLCAM